MFKDKETKESFKHELIALCVRYGIGSDENTGIVEYVDNAKAAADAMIYISEMQTAFKEPVAQYHADFEEFGKPLAKSRGIRIIKMADTMPSKCEVKDWVGLGSNYCTKQCVYFAGQTADIIHCLAPLPVPHTVEDGLKSTSNPEHIIK